MSACMNCGREAGINQIFCDDVCYKNAHGIGDEDTPLEYELRNAKNRIAHLEAQLIAARRAAHDQYCAGYEKGRKYEREAVVKALWKWTKQG